MDKSEDYFLVAGELWVQGSEKEGADGRRECSGDEFVGEKEEGVVKLGENAEVVELVGDKELGVEGQLLQQLPALLNECDGSRLLGVL